MGETRRSKDGKTTVRPNTTGRKVYSTEDKLGSDWQSVQSNEKVNRDKKKDKETWVDRWARAYPGSVGRALGMKGF